MHSCFSVNKKGLGRNKDYALTWFFGTKLHDSTFRVVYDKIPKVHRHVPGFAAEIGRHYEITCEIRAYSATYWIDGIEYASCTYDKSDVPDTGFLGFGVNRR